MQPAANRVQPANQNNAQGSAAVGGVTHTQTQRDREGERQREARLVAEIAIDNEVCVINLSLMKIINFGATKREG